MARAKAKYEITADDKTAQGTRSANSRMEKLSRTTAQFSRAAKIGIAALGAAFGFLAVKANSVADKLDRVAKAGRKIGVEGPQAGFLEFLGAKTGLGIDALVNGLEQLNERVADAAQGGTEARRQFALLGVRFSRFEDALPLEKLALLADGLSKIEDITTRTRIEKTLFGAGAERLFAGGAEGILAQAQRFTELGGAARQAEAQNAAEQFNDAATDFTAALDSAWRKYWTMVLRAGERAFTLGANAISGRATTIGNVPVLTGSAPDAGQRGAIGGIPVLRDTPEKKELETQTGLLRGIERKIGVATYQ